ncbi:hypothetical protein Tco_1095403 [Tanacetum coccineum]
MAEYGGIDVQMIENKAKNGDFRVPGGGGWPIRKRHVSKTRDPKRVSIRPECAEVSWQLMIGSEGIWQL